MDIDFSGFRVCGLCSKINLASDSSCRHCKNLYLYTIEQTAKNNPFWSIFAVCAWLVISFLSLYTGCFALIISPVVGFILYQAGCNRVSERRNRLMREATGFAQSLAHTQIDDARTIFATGSEHFSAGNYQAAALSFESARRLGVDDASLTYHLAVSYYNLKDYTTALPLLESLLAVPEYPEVPQIYAWACVKSDRIDADSTPNLQATWRESTGALRKLLGSALANYYLKQSSQTCESVEVLLEVLETDSERRDVAVTAAVALVQLGDLNHACELFSRFPISQYDPETLSVYAHACSRIEAADQSAIDLFEFHLAKQPDDAEIAFRIVQLLAALRERERAVAHCIRFLSHCPEDIRIRYHLALLYIGLGKEEEGIAELQQLLRTPGFEEYRSKSDIHRVLSRCFLRAGMADLALRQILVADRAVASLELLYDLGRWFEAHGQPQSAVPCWQEIYAADVRFRDVAARLKGG